MQTVDTRYKTDIECMFMYKITQQQTAIKVAKRKNLYIVIEDDGDFSCREWKVIGVHHNIRNASIQAWQHVIDEATQYEFIRQWWYKTDQKHISERAKYSGIGFDVHILVWDMTTNTHSGTWYVKKNAAFRSIGAKGKDHFMSSLNNWHSCLQEINRVPLMLWNEYMEYKHQCQAA